MVRLQIGRIARSEQLVHGISICDLMKALNLTDLEVARVALVLDDILLRTVRQRNHAAIRVHDVQVATERDHGNHVKVAQVIEQAMQLIDRHGLVKQHLVGLGIDYVCTVKGHEQAIVIVQAELLTKGAKAPCRTARSQNELDTRFLRREQLLARARANHLLVVGERTVDIHCDGFDCHMSLPTSSLSRTIISERSARQRTFLKKILVKTLKPVYFKDDRCGGHHLIEHIQFQFSACKRKKIGI